MDNEKNIKIEVGERIDANTCQKLQDELLISFQKSSNVILNFEKTKYISSAGLRALLIGHKTANSKNGTMILRNVSEVVRNVLDMSGFTQILRIENK